MKCLFTTCKLNKNIVSYDFSFKSGQELLDILHTCMSRVGIFFCGIAKYKIEIFFKMESWLTFMAKSFFLSCSFSNNVSLSQQVADVSIFIELELPYSYQPAHC